MVWWEICLSTLSTFCSTFLIKWDFVAKSQSEYVQSLGSRLPASGSSQWNLGWTPGFESLTGKVDSSKGNLSASRKLSLLGRAKETCCSKDIWFFPPKVRTTYRVTRSLTHSNNILSTMSQNKIKWGALCAHFEPNTAILNTQTSKGSPPEGTVTIFIWHRRNWNCKA